MNQAEQASNVIEVWIARMRMATMKSLRTRMKLLISGMKMSEVFRGG
jgi:hypothetical protein